MNTNSHNNISQNMIDEFYLELKKSNAAMTDLYTSESVLLTPRGDVIRGKDIADYYKNEIFADSTFSSIDTVFRCHSEIGIYEISDFSCNNGLKYSALIHWIQIDGQLKREYEILSHKNDSVVGTAKIDAQRESFCHIINSTHDVNALIQDVYSSKPYYFNRGRLLEGGDSIVSEYSYMADASFEIFLAPDVIHPVTDTCIFEIGSWRSGANSGKYVLIWINENNCWKILFDSNY